MPKSEQLNKSTKIILNYVLGGALCVWLTFAIYQQILHQQNLPAAWTHMKTTVMEKGWLLMLVVVVMMFLNWGLEARKWQLLVQPLEEVPFRRAFGAILSGVSLSVNTPNRIGEYGGRILYLRNKNKLKAIAATIVGSFSQLIITIVFGLIGFIYYINQYEMTRGGNFEPAVREKLLLAFLLVICTLVLILYFRLQIIVTLFEKIPWLRKVKVFIQIIARYSPTELRKLLLLSALRYTVFSAQYLILLYALGVSFVWWQGFFMINVIYLVMAVLPTIAIAEIGLRGSVSMHFLGLLSTNAAGILAATVAIWLINLVLPAVMGSLLLLGVKIFKTNSD
ncbi:lysylphosphatidylglycerol synthase domain-containing protein [Chitinophaga lutea]|uniref:lysylphosphatidylglycerol synthase domain-containing protein n=1 Tax=Chitinophaga lutea TaxID=2488634 RepID=UPI00131513BE|nr:lysylphosphatidylglycerol synthase domain-containing protein [Chitinophaga lutea]